MPASEPYVSAHLSIVARFYDAGGAKIAEMRDVVSVSASFALNTIPTATLTVAVGYNPLENNKPATIHTILPQIKPRQRVIVELTINKGGGDVTRLAAAAV